DLFIAVRDNPHAAASFGISVTAIRRLAFFISGALAGSAGVLYAFHQQVVDTDRFPAGAGLGAFSMVVIGGLGSISGVVMGATFLRGTQYLLPNWAGFFASGVGLLMILIAFPGGLGEALLRTRYRVIEWIARRHGL